MSWYYHSFFIMSAAGDSGAKNVFLNVHYVGISAISIHIVVYNPLTPSFLKLVNNYGGLRQPKSCPLQQIPVRAVN